MPSYIIGFHVSHFLKMNTKFLNTLKFLAVLPLAACFSNANTERVELWPEGKAPVSGGKFENAKPIITVHHPGQPNGTAMVICPGGGYGTLMKNPEGHGIAKWLNGHGITGVVLEYRLPKGDHFRPLSDAQRAIRMIRAKAKEWKVDPKKVGIIGFSAGGHLSSSVATHFDKGDPGSQDPIQRQSCRPDFAVLVYPVITMGKGTHGGSRRNLLGKDPSQEQIDLFSNEKQVTKDTPPCYLAHAKNDAVVPVAHSRMFHKALLDNGIKARYFEPETGNHGFNRYKGPVWDEWQKQSVEWLDTMGF